MGSRTVASGKICDALFWIRFNRCSCSKVGVYAVGTLGSVGGGFEAAIAAVNSRKDAESAAKFLPLFLAALKVDMAN